MKTEMLTELSKLLTPSQNRYDSPRKEVMQLRTLWVEREIPNTEIDFKKAKQLYRIITEKLNKGAELSSIMHLVTKGLFLDPKFHLFYAWKGDFYSQKNNWTQAIKNYQQARILSKSGRNHENVYKNNLIQVYKKRASDYEKNEEISRALADYEQILVLTLEENMKFTVQDKILNILRSIERYIAFRFYLIEFIKSVDSLRTSNLLTQYAEYNIVINEISVARKILFQAIKLDSKNTKAQDLLLNIFFIGHSMVSHAIIWCAYGCYDKALFTIEKGRDCDPYNPGYAVLKTIVLRVSGRLFEAARWLNVVNKEFHKFLEPSRDKQGSIMGNFTISQAKLEFIRQWHLIRYDLAVEFMMNGQFEEAIPILKEKNLQEMFAETNTLLGDCYLNLKMPTLALRSYIKSLEKHRELKTLTPESKKRLHLMQRLANIITSNTFKFSPSEEMIKLGEKVLRIFEEEKIDYKKIVCQQ